MIFDEEYLQDLFKKLKTSPSESYESELIEFKNYESESSLHNSKDIVDEISALANLKGGIIIIGIKDSSNIQNKNWHEQLCGFCKVDLDTTKERIKGKIRPTIDIKFRYFTFENKDYLCIDIPKKIDSIISTSGGKVCIRDGKSSRAATPEEIILLVKSLQFYDWSAEDVDIPINEALNNLVIDAAIIDYRNRRNITPQLLDKKIFLESIGATKNGILNKGGLLFLGKADYIKKHLGNFEYRFTWKEKNGNLKINEVWSDCLWISIKKAKADFDICNSKLEITFQNEDFILSKLDNIAFHEAYLNALVHRDYSHSGMVSANCSESVLKITSPGCFYGGISSENIVYHESRHRNKSLAHMLMLFNLIDRAGVGVTRIGISSLKYGRSFPTFLEKADCIEVVMEAEYLRSGIFVLTKKNPSLGIVDMFILNSVYNEGYILLPELENRLRKISETPWAAIEKSMSDSIMANYVEYKGSKNGVYICVKDSYKDFFQVKKSLKIGSTKDKHIDLYKYLKEFGTASNEEISSHLKIKHASQTSLFLKNSEFVKKGKALNSKWTLK